MLKRMFYLKALWDEDAKVFYSESDIEGLHIQSADIDLFEEIMFDTAMDLIVANHISERDLADTPLTELIPAILWQKPTSLPTAA
jgi:Domain of unknown function (DUF1902)